MYLNNLAAIILCSSFAAFPVIPMLLPMKSKQLIWSLSWTHKRLMHLKCRSHLNSMLEDLKSWALKKPSSATYICTSALPEHINSSNQHQQVLQCPRSYKVLSNTPHLVFSSTLSWATSNRHSQSTTGQGSKPEARPLPEYACTQQPDN